MADPVARRRYSLIVGLEFGLLVAGAAELGSNRAVQVDCGVGLIRRWGAFLPAGRDAGQPVVAAARGVADGCGRGGAGRRAGSGDVADDGHWRRGWVLLPRL